MLKLPLVVCTFGEDSHCTLIFSPVDFLWYFPWCLFSLMFSPVNFSVEAWWVFGKVVDYKMETLNFNLLGLALHILFVKLSNQINHWEIDLYFGNCIFRCPMCMQYFLIWCKVSPPCQSVYLFTYIHIRGCTPAPVSNAQFNHDGQTVLCIWIVRTCNVLWFDCASQFHRIAWNQYLDPSLSFSCIAVLATGCNLAIPISTP